MAEPRPSSAAQLANPANNPLHSKYLWLLEHIDDEDEGGEDDTERGA